jgi:tRNA A-37 threonylcarbamoyl transferase component Bud32
MPDYQRRRIASRMNSPRGDDKDIFLDAVEWPAGERAARLTALFPDDPRRVSDLLSLLDHASRPAPVFDASAQASVRPPERTDDEELGDTPRYHRVRRIGEGAFGIVYLAEQLEPVRRQVAMKILKPGMDSKAVLARFEQERQALAVLEHPGTARIFDAGVTSRGLPFFAMEYVAGTPITEFVRAERLDPKAIARLFALVCDAVQHAHSKGIVHRDLKPTNILVARDAEGRPAPRVIDFGILKATQDRLSDSTLATGQGLVVGTPEYMSPEQASGELDIDTRSDVYSLGLVLFELLAGRPARSFAGVPALAKLERVRAEQAPRLARAVPPLRGDLDAIVSRALDASRERRYPTVAALADDLRRHLDHLPVNARPPSSLYQASRFARRHPGPVIGAVTAAVALTAGLVATSWALRERTREAARATIGASALESILGRITDAQESMGNESPAARSILAQQIPTIAGTDPLLGARLKMRLAEIYISGNEGGPAFTLTQQAYETFAIHYGPNHASALDARNLNLVVRMIRGEDARADLDQLLKDAETWLGPRSPTTLRIAFNRAYAKADGADLATVRELYHPLLERAFDVLGPTSDDAIEGEANYATALFTLSESLGKSGSKDEAATLLREATRIFSVNLERRKSASGPSSVAYNRALTNYGAVLSKDEQFGPAAEALKTSLQHLRTRLPDSHELVVNTALNYVEVIKAAGRPQEALDLANLILAGQPPDAPPSDRVNDLRDFVNRCTQSLPTTP